MIPGMSLTGDTLGLLGAMFVWEILLIVLPHQFGAWNSLNSKDSLEDSPYSPH